MTGDFGKIATLAKGARRPKSAFLGHMDLFYTCELLFYARPRTGLHLARESSPLKLRQLFRTDWRCCAAASYLAGLAAGAVHDDAPHRDLFELLDVTLDDIARSGAREGVLFWAELKLLSGLGLAPRLQSCAVCRRRRQGAAHSVLFSEAEGGIVCRQCAAQRGHIKTRLPPDVLSVLTAWQASATPAEARAIRPSRPQCAHIEKALGSFMRYHLDMELPGRSIALELIRRRIPRQKALSPGPGRD
jgi:DNA repair protein RecO